METSIRTLAPDDYDAIAAVADSWWGRPILAVLPRVFVDHFWATSLLAEDSAGALAGFLVGFDSPGRPECSYIHFVGVRPDQRRTGLARALYQRFFDRAAAAGRLEVHAITSPVNAGSVRFHRALGFTVTGPVADYDGPGRPMMVFGRGLR